MSTEDSVERFYIWRDAISDKVFLRDSESPDAEPEAFFDVESALERGII
jgi:hypothetical protein